MLFFSDNRSIAHVSRDKETPIYTFIFPNETLEERLAVLNTMADEVRKGIWKRDEELAKQKAEEDARKAEMPAAEPPVEDAVVEKPEEAQS